MNFVYYNPETMSNPSTTLNGVKEVAPDNPWIRYAKPYATREDALSEDSTGGVYFYENGVLYEAYRIGAWKYKPCTDVECNSGINWNDYYAVTVERLYEYLSERYGKLLNFKPTLNKYGLYEIQVHYDGRCR